MKNRRMLFHGAVFALMVVLVSSWLIRRQASESEQAIIKKVPPNSERFTKTVVERRADVNAGGLQKSSRSEEEGKVSLVEGVPEFVTSLATSLAVENSPASLRDFFDLVRSLPSGVDVDSLVAVFGKFRGPLLAPVLLECLRSESNLQVLRMVKQGLIHNMNRTMVEELVQVYDSCGNDAVRKRIEAVFRSVANEDAVEGLADLVGGDGRPTFEPLIAAAIDGLAGLQSPAATAAMLRRIDVAGSDEDVERVCRAVAAIGSLEARSVLENVAVGAKEMIAVRTRCAAIRALKNFPDIRAEVLLQKLSADPLPEVGAVAREVLASLLFLQKVQ